MRRVILAALLTCLVVAPAAHADGDPASDYLLSSSVFLPPDVVIPHADSKQLVDEVAAAKAHGYEIRVAVIGTRYDLGSVGALFEQPRRYAVFLGQELRFVYKGRLLVVMPNGFGVSQAGKPLSAVPRGVADQPSSRNTDLVAVVLVAVVLVAVVLLGGAVALLVGRRRRLSAS